MDWVVDTNVIIDFHKGSLLDELFQLPLTLHAPDFLMAEMISPSAARLEALGILIHIFSGAQLQEIIQLRMHHNRISIPDLAAFLLAKSRSFGLLTGDRTLRDLATVEGIEIHGTLWLLDELIRYNIVTPSQAVTCLETMLQMGRYLPHGEAQNRLRLWRRG